MTIYLMVLKKLIKEQLSPISSDLARKSKAYGYNHNLSKDQKQIIDLLEEAIVLFEGGDDDESDAKRMTAILEKARVDIQKVREQHGEARDGGETIKCLNGLIFNTSGFHAKLAEFSFDLLNKHYSETPENIVYYHAAYYFGDEIFTPKPNLDIDIRNKKEERLAIRLQSLSELIKPEHTLEEQRPRALQVLQDLAADNKRVIKKDDGAALAVPGLSFWGWQVTAPTDWFSAGEGRFGEEFNMAVRKIKALTAESFAPAETNGGVGPAAARA